MALSDITNAAVRSAITEFDELGRDAFLQKYGFGKARDYFLIHLSQYYDSKAVCGAAHGYLEGKSPLPHEEFSGGDSTVRDKLENLGFEVTTPETLPFVGAAPGDVLSNSELTHRFSIGNMGGMRRNARARHLVLVSDPSKGLYDDRMEGDILHYTGMGKVGDQTLASQNRTLAESRGSGEVIHLFEALEPQRYTYIGEVELVGDPYQETQPDVEGNPRLVWMFPIKPKVGGFKAQPSERQVRAVKQAREKIVTKLSLEELRKRAMAAKGKPSRRSVTSEQVSRDPIVSEYVKRMAKGHCDLCEYPAPFLDKKKRPYFECHHVVHLANGGEDAVSNAVALCPNCHRKMHSLNLKTDKQKLIKRISKRDA